MTFDEIKKNKEVNEFITKGNYNLGLLGYTDHSQIHSGLVAQTAAVILKKFGYTDEDIELARALMGMKYRKTIIVPSLKMKLAVTGQKLLPECILLKIVAKQQKRKQGK